MSFFDDSSSGFAAFGGDGGFFRSSTAPFGGSSGRGGAARVKPEGRRSGGSWGDNSGFWSEEGASFSSPAPSQTQGEGAFQRRGASNFSTTSPGAGGLIYATVGMLLRAAEEAAPSRRNRTQEQGINVGDTGASDELSNSSGGLKLRLHGQELTTVGLRGWVSAPGAQHLPSAVRFVLCDGTGEIDVEVGLVGGRPWWGDSRSTNSRGQDDAEITAAALWNFASTSCDPSDVEGKCARHDETSLQQQKDTTAENSNDDNGTEGSPRQAAKEESPRVNKGPTEHQGDTLTKKFLEPGSLVRVTGALLLLARGGAASRRPPQGPSNDEDERDEEHSSVDDAPRVYLEAITCAPIKDAREFSVLHPVEIAFGAATFLSRSGRLTQPSSALQTKDHKKAKLQQNEKDDSNSVKQRRCEAEDQDNAKHTEHMKLLQQEYGHVEDPLQQKIILFLLQHGESEKRVSKERLITHLCHEVVADQRCSMGVLVMLGCENTAEQVEKALRELEEAAETIEHAGLIALAC